MTPILRKLLFETLYKNRYLYRFASTIPFAGQWRTWQRLVLPRLQGHDVLELGCGLGDLLADMLEAGYNCRAVEHSPAMVAAARDTLHKRKVGGSTNVIQGSAQSLPFSDETFDNVVSTFPSEYIYDRDTISEIKRVLRSGGRVIIIESANLLPVGYIQPFLMFIHFLVYGPSTFFGSRKQRRFDETGTRNRQGVQSGKNILSADRDKLTNVITEELPATTFGHLIPLEHFGLRRRSELVRSRRWEVFITIAEKPPAISNGGSF
jgi:ubiquinone/menaquinone biosynthesis C-methylase UbiE